MPSDKPIFFTERDYDWIKATYPMTLNELQKLSIAEHSNSLIQPLLQAMEIMRLAIEEYIETQAEIGGDKKSFSQSEFEEALKKCDEIFSSKDNK